jgi:flavin-dependent dehydrogenase
VIVPNTYEVIIVGASLAGSSLALRLARRGVSVAVFDKAKFPRRKACGEGVSSIGVRLLKELGITPGSTELPANLLDGYVLCRGRRKVEVPFIEQDSCSDSGYGIQRLVLDSLIIKRATAAGVRFELGTSVRSVTRSAEGGWIVEAAGQIVHGKTLVLADGANSIVAESLGIHSEVKTDPRFGFSMVLEGQSASPISRVHILVHDTFEIACTPVSPTLLNTTIMAPRSSIADSLEPAQLQSILSAVREQTGFIGAVCEDERAPLGIGPLNRSRRGGFHDGVFLVGDACETLDPIGGMGMTHALVSAALAEKSLWSHLRQSQDIFEAGRSYEAKRESEMRALRGFTRLTYFYLRKMSHTSLFPALGNSALIREVSRAAHRNIAPSVLGFCCNLLLNVVGFL